MSTDRKILGVLRPLGGGDPIPLLKEELSIGRRPSCDIRLDFDNVSGKHCILRLERGVWTLRDLGSSNGTTVNGARLSSERGVLPDDELGIANHFYAIDYEPTGAVMTSMSILEEEFAERPRRSLMEMAGLESESRPSTRARRPSERSAPTPATMSRREETPAREDTVIDEDPPAIITPASPPAPPEPSPISDEEYFKMFEEGQGK